MFKKTFKENVSENLLYENDAALYSLRNEIFNSMEILFLFIYLFFFFFLLKRGKCIETSSAK